MRVGNDRDRERQVKRLRRRGQDQVCRLVP
jgi:hypothetical protein